MEKPKIKSFLVVVTADLSDIFIQQLRSTGKHTNGISFDERKEREID